MATVKKEIIFDQPQNTRLRFAPGGWVNAESLSLLCPVCQSQFQHHGQVEVFTRPGGEDEESVVLDSETGEQRPADGNPSPRRHAVRIHFNCEAGHIWYFDVIQHKGWTDLSCSVVGECTTTSEPD